jgi:hypothetical protein
MALVAVENKQNCPAIIVVSEGIHLGQKNILQPFDGDLIAGPAIIRADIVPWANLLELSKKPLGLKLFSFKDNTRFEVFARSGDGVYYRNPRATATVFDEDLLCFRSAKHKRIDS